MSCGVGCSKVLSVVTALAMSVQVLDVALVLVVAVLATTTLLVTAVLASMMELVIVMLAVTVVLVVTAVFSNIGHSVIDLIDGKLYVQSQ